MEMELKSSSPKFNDLSPPNSVSDPQEKEISDDDDDDRNHKHRRREIGSQSSDRDSLEQSLRQPYRKRNRPFENGQSDPHSLDRDFSKFGKRRTMGVNFSRFSGEHGSGRGRGRDYQRDSRFGNIDVASQMAHPGSIPSAMFLARGLSNVSNAATASWNSFGLLPAIPNGAIEAINPLGMPILRPQINPALNMGIQRQRCRDFEERGFCLRGDMCPMEHGVNRIVIEDVQSLSHFNLPVSLPSAHLLGTSSGGGFVPSVSVASSTAVNSIGVHSRTSKFTVADDALNLDGAFSADVNANGADVYDPDQPLWNTNGDGTSTQLLALQPPNLDDPVVLMDAELSGCAVRSSGGAIGSQSTSSSVWGRLRSSENKLELKENYDSRKKPSEYQESRSKEIREASSDTQVTSHLGKKNVSTFSPKTVGSTYKVLNDVGSNVKKPTQKAQRTLFVNCIPLKDNKKENLLSHFRRFGEVIDTYIPANSERAFVQFSKREEAERALKAPDAVMGSRFIKLWWANRDSISDEGMRSGNNGSVTPRDAQNGSGSPHPAVSNKGKDNLQYVASKVAMPKTSHSLMTAVNDFKPVIANEPKAPLPTQKKIESLELLKGELRKKQEMLEQKRNEFRRQLDKLAKQSPGFKSEMADGHATKKQKVETSTDAIKSGTSADAVISGSSLQNKTMVDKVSNVESFASQGYKTNSAAAVHDPQSLKQAAHPVATSGIPFHANRYKLDNRPTAFRIRAPLPAGLANVSALRDHFSLYGEVSNAEIEELNEEDSPNPSNNSEAMRKCSARISFRSRHTAGRAFLNGKSWNGHNLQFVWVNCSIPSSSTSSGESSSALRGGLNSEVQSAEKTTQDAFGPSDGNTLPRKSLNELSGGSSRSVFEAQSPDKSASYIPLENDEPENRDYEPEVLRVVEEGASGGDEMQKEAVLGKRDLSNHSIC